MREPEERTRLAGVLRQLSAAVKDYGRLVTHYDPSAASWRSRTCASTWTRLGTARTG